MSDNPGLVHFAIGLEIFVLTPVPCPMGNCCFLRKCVAPEKIHTPPTEGTGISWGDLGGCQRPQNLSKCMKLDWNFQRGGGWGGLRKNCFHGGGVDDFGTTQFKLQKDCNQSC